MNNPGEGQFGRGRLGSSLRAVGGVLVFFSAMGLGYLPSMSVKAEMDSHAWWLLFLVISGLALVGFARHWQALEKRNSVVREVIGWTLFMLGSVTIGCGGAPLGLILLIVALLLLRQPGGRSGRADSDSGAPEEHTSDEMNQ